MKSITTMMCLGIVLGALVTELRSDEAAELLSRAHQARATWNGFPGFRANVQLRDNDTQASGWVEISAQGDVRFEVPGAPNWFGGKLRSFVEHRFGSPDSEYQARLESEAIEHPLGRLIRIENDALMGSLYRIDGDVVREVHRNPRDSKFTITVLDVHRNPKGKYVPRVYTVSYWDNQGQLVAVTVERDDWIYRDGWDLPQGWITVRSAPGREREVRSVTFSDHTWLATENVLPGQR